MTPVIIAELGSSPAPDWNFDLWCRLAARSGATNVKVQLFKAEHFPEAEQAAKRPLEFPRDRLAEFMLAAHKYELKAGASVFDLEAVRLVATECDFIKLAAREQNNAQLTWNVSYMVNRRIPIYRSHDSKGGYLSWPEITNLITIPEYPAPLVLSLITVACFAWRMKNYGLPWGYSSHTTSDLDVRLAAWLGASVIEKHFCLAHTDLEGGHSLTPPEFKRMVERIK